MNFCPFGQSERSPSNFNHFHWSPFSSSKNQLIINKKATSLLSKALKKTKKMTIPNPEVTPEIKFKHFLYLGSELNTFITGDLEFHKHFTERSLSALTELVKSDPSKVCRIVANVNSTNALPTRKTLFYALASTVKTAGSGPSKHEIYTTVLNSIKSHEDLFDFIKYLSKMKGTFSSGLNKILRHYYNNLEPMQLLQDVCLQKGYHSWTHKDIFKLSHIKVEQIDMLVVITYIMKGLEDAAKVSGDKESPKRLLAFIKESESFKTSMNEANAIRHIMEYKISLEYCPPRFIKSSKVVNAAISNTDLKYLLKILHKLWKSGLMRQEADIVTRTVVDLLTNENHVKSSQIHPIEVFLAIKFFDNGGKSLDPRLVKYLEEAENKRQAKKPEGEKKKTDFAHRDPLKCPPITSALNKCLAHSYQNVSPVNRRFLITVEVSENMDKPCLNSKCITCLEAAVILLATFLRTEKDVIVAVFNGPAIAQVSLDKGGSLIYILKKLKEVKGGAVQLGAPMDWARENKQSVDVFLNINYEMVHKDVLAKDQPLLNPWEGFAKYKSAMNMSTPKLIINNLQGTSVYVDIPSNAIDIRGFDKNVPKVIDAFLKNYI